MTSVSDIMSNFDTFGFMEHNIQNGIGMWKEEQESLVYCCLNVDPTLNWLEIGSFMGGSATLMCLTRRTTSNTPKIISVDIDFSAFRGAFKRNVYRVGSFGDIHQSLEISSFDLDSVYNEPLSFAFIDGWHSFKGVYKDFITVNKNIVSGGIVSFHDTYPQPYPVGKVDEFYNVAKKDFDELMEERLPSGKFDNVLDYFKSETKQNFRIDEVVALAINEYGYDLVELPTISGQTHFDRVAKYEHGTTSPYPGFVAIRKR